MASNWLLPSLAFAATLSALVLENDVESMNDTGKIAENRE